MSKETLGSKEPHNSQLACGPPIRGGAFGTGDRTLLSNLTTKKPADKTRMQLSICVAEKRVKQKKIGTKTP